VHSVLNEVNKGFLHYFDVYILHGYFWHIVDNFEKLQIVSQVEILNDPRKLGKDLEGAIWAEMAKLD
jgi:hypothetical protein